MMARAWGILHVISPKFFAASLVIFAALLLSPHLAPAATPTLVQHVSSSANPVGVGISGNNFKFTLPNPVGAGNCLILGLSYPSGNTPIVTDNNGNTWPASPAVSANGGAGNYVASIFVLPNARSGLTSITVSFGAAIIPFNYVISEFNNIATVSPVNGTSSTANKAGPSLTTGSFTPGNNDANGGNLIWNYYAISSIASNNPTSWVPGGNFALLDGDIAWTTNQGFPHASQYSIQTTAAIINPSITSTGDTEAYNAVAVALQIAVAGTPAPAGIYINKIIHETSTIIPGSWSLQLPAVGNLRVITTTTPGWTGITDNEGGTWIRVGAVDAQLYYSANKSPNPNLKITIAAGSGAGVPTSVRFYDISGAAASPFDTSATLDSTNVSNQVTINNAPVITPTTANGLVIGALQIGQGPGLAITSPSGAVFDLVHYTGEVDMDLMENADGNAHIYNTTTATQNWNWNITSNSPNSLTAVAAAFKAGAVTIATDTHDFNGDGKSDIAWRDTGGNAAVWLMNGAALLQSGGLGSAPTTWSVVGQRDFNGDGKADWLWRDTSGNVAIWFMNGAQVAQSAGVGNVATAWSVAGVGDFNGDGKGDILWQDTGGNLAIWFMNGVQAAPAGVAALPAGWTVAGTGDFNGDGKTDILLHDTSGNVGIWFMNGAQVTPAGVGALSAGWSIVGTGDFNGDGKSDILLRDTAGDVGIWFMNGAQVTPAGVGNIATAWSIAETGDFNGDGKSDILWQDASGDVGMWFMNGAQATPAGVGTASTIWSIQGANAD
jgi:hypothetical protein